ncbi:MAG: type II toxin-antitoxin system toxin DNA ADP-ribosyl transferase DarT [Pseudohongiellaceae bacterium]
MTVPVPPHPKIYRITHVNSLPSIIAGDFLWCDAEMAKRPSSGTPIGIDKIKQRRLTELKLNSHPDLYVGECVPFYFCPRSVMLYMLHVANHSDLSYRGGQKPIVHLEFDLRDTVSWADKNKNRWAFTSSNAGARDFGDWCDLSQLNEIDWDAVRARDWRTCKYGKQAEFLVERNLPWSLTERIGVYDNAAYQQVSQAITESTHKPELEIIRDWYY